MNKAILFIFSGLPAVGKSTLAKSVVKYFEAVYLRIDTIEQGLKDLCHIDVEGGRLSVGISYGSRQSAIRQQCSG